MPSVTDNEQLASLGYTTELTRSVTLWQSFALGFTYLSPVVGAYSLFAFGVQTAGPPMIWSYLLAGCGMMMVCLVFGEVVSQFPIAGGIYPWARRLAGRKWSWMAGWIYAWALYATIAGAAVGAAPFLAPLIDIAVTPATTTVIAVAIIAGATACNLTGTKILAKIALVGFACEILGAIFVGGYLLFFHRIQPVGALVTDYGFSTNGSFLPAFFAATLVGMVCCYGFEACGDLAEETPDPGRRVPLAMRMTIYIGIPVTMLSVAGLLLAIPDMAAVTSGRVHNPVAFILISAFGSLRYKLILAIIMVSFGSAVLSLQAAVSRLIYAFARDRMVIGSSVLARISRRHHVPVPSLVIAGIIPSAIVCIGSFAANALTLIVGFAAVGIYIAFQMVVLAALYARGRGWKPAGKFRLGIWAWPVNTLALLYGLAAIVNMLWPRPVQNFPWYLNYAQHLMTIAVAGSGLIYLLIARPERHGNAPAGDAWIRPALPAMDPVQA